MKRGIKLFVLGTLMVQMFISCNGSGGRTEQAQVSSGSAGSVSKVTPVSPNGSAAPAGTPIGPPSAVAEPSAERKTTAHFEETVYDWGTLKVGEKMTHIFRFKNTGNQPLVIKDAKTTCGCTVPEKPQAPIEPGKMGELKVVFDSHNKFGTQVKPITVTSNTVPETIQLTIKGEVK